MNERSLPEMPDRRMWDPEWKDDGPLEDDDEAWARYEAECEKADRAIDRRKEGEE